jgi:hypothetical protein
MGELAWLSAGTTEAIAVVTPMEVVKIRLQAQMCSLADPLETSGIGTRDMRCILSCGRRESGHCIEECRSRRCGRRTNQGGCFPSNLILTSRFAFLSFDD